MLGVLERIIAGIANGPMRDKINNEIDKKLKSSMVSSNESSCPVALPFDTGREINTSSLLYLLGGAFIFSCAGTMYIWIYMQTIKKNLPEKFKNKQYNYFENNDDDCTSIINDALSNNSNEIAPTSSANAADEHVSQLYTTLPLIMLPNLGSFSRYFTLISVSLTVFGFVFAHTNTLAVAQGVLSLDNEIMDTIIVEKLSFFLTLKQFWDAQAYLMAILLIGGSLVFPYLQMSIALGNYFWQKKIVCVWKRGERKGGSLNNGRHNVMFF